VSEEGAPGLALIPRETPAPGGQRITLALASGSLLGPHPLDEAFLFQLVENGIEGAVLEIEKPVATLLDIQGQLVSVPSSVGERDQDKGLVAALGQVLGGDFGFAHDPGFLLF